MVQASAAAVVSKPAKTSPAASERRLRSRVWGQPSNSRASKVSTRSGVPVDGQPARSWTKRSRMPNSSALASSPLRRKGFGSHLGKKCMATLLMT
ncbi:Uncharacterised protein [Mycobacteroides abscessus subsp. abscessus]|nr:Uncharacterised protein [Mycobacteroides abscessus subsp. abscessus]